MFLYLQKLFPRLKKIHFYIALLIFIFFFVFFYSLDVAISQRLSYINKILAVLVSPKPFIVRFPWNVRFFKLSQFIYSLFFVGLYFFYTFFLKENPKKLRDGREYGSARWGEKKDIEGFIDFHAAFNNVLLSETESLSMNPKPEPWTVQRNKNIIIVGGSGSGKTRYFVKPNLMQMHSSFVVTDPKGTILSEVGEMLLRGSPKIKRKTLSEEEIKKGQILGKEIYEKNSIVYERDEKGNLLLEPFLIKVLNLINFKKSMKYNPFKYLKTEKDILSFVNVLMANTNTSDGKTGGDDFWAKSERLLFTALISYIKETLLPKEQNFGALLDLLNNFEVREQDENFKNVIDRLFDRLEVENPESLAVNQYKKFKLAAGKTAKSILISCAARLAPFDIKELRELMEEDELDIDLLGEEKTAFFVIIPDSDATFNFIAAILYTQMFNLLITKADDVYDGSLPIPIRFLLDEFVNTGLIPQFEKLIATIRSRGMSASIILQTESQIKALYKDHAETIVGNCDSYVFLGGNEKSTLKNINEILGKETIDTITNGRTYSMQQSASSNFARTGRELMTKEELANMPRNKCIVLISGLYPFYSEKFNLKKHPNYIYLAGETNSKYSLLDVEKYIKNFRKNVNLKNQDVLGKGERIDEEWLDYSFVNIE